MFVPKGNLLLTAAIDQLAEVRRPAGQTNDDGKNAARTELRAEFHSGSMLTTVIDPGSGKTYTIFPDRWALEKALTWLERGECPLTEGLVYPRLGIQFRKEPTVEIFVSEHELLRLMAKEEVKQEAVPPPFSPIEVANPFAEKRRPGRRKGQGSFESQDRLLFPEMERLISSGAAVSPEGAARLLAQQAHGAGSVDSKTERLAKRFRNRAD